MVILAPWPGENRVYFQAASDQRQPLFNINEAETSPFRLAGPNFLNIQAVTVVFNPNDNGLVLLPSSMLTSVGRRV